MLKEYNENIYVNALLTADSKGRWLYKAIRSILSVKWVLSKHKGAQIYAKLNRRDSQVSTTAVLTNNSIQTPNHCIFPMLSFAIKGAARTER